MAAVPGQPPPPAEVTKACRSCGAEPEFASPLCADCRTKLAQQPIPVGIKLAGIVIALLLLLALTRIPSSLSAAIAFERGERSEQKLQFAVAENEYHKSVLTFPRSDLAHTRLVERRNVLLGVFLEDVLIADTPRRVAGARFPRSEDREVDTRFLEKLRRRLSRLLRTLVERRGAAHPV